jgi:hypothetical protein
MVKPEDRCWWGGQFFEGHFCKQDSEAESFKGELNVKRPDRAD